MYVGVSALVRDITSGYCHCFYDKDVSSLSTCFVIDKVRFCKNLLTTIKSFEYNFTFVVSCRQRMIWQWNAYKMHTNTIKYIIRGINNPLFGGGWFLMKNFFYQHSHWKKESFFFTVSKADDRSRGQTKGSFFNSYYTAVYRGRCYSFLLTAPLYSWYVPYNAEFKQGGIKYHFLSLWYDSTWDWTPREPFENILPVRPMARL